MIYIVLETDSENQNNHENSIDIYSYQASKNGQASYEKPKIG
jgi:hypothetical protein